MNNKTFNAEHRLMLSTRFYEDPTVRSLQKEFGYKGSVLALAILMEIARNDGKARLNNAFFKSITDKFPEISRNLVKMVVRRMTDAGFLYKPEYIEDNILSVPGKFLVANEEDVYGGHEDQSAPYFVAIGMFYNDWIQKQELLQRKSEKTAVTAEKTSVSSDKTRINSEEINISSEEITNNSEKTLVSSNKTTVSSDKRGVSSERVENSNF